MKFHFILFVTFSMYIFVSCQGKIDNSNIIKDIPKDGRGKPTLSYTELKPLIDELELDKLENGFDSLQIRLWYGYTGNDTAHLIILKNINGNWNAQLFTLKIDYSHGSRAISKYIVTKAPNSGWPRFLRRLFELQIMDLPDFTQIKNYPSIAHGDALTVEIGTTKKYRYYRYINPNRAGVEKGVNEALKMENILELLENEFNFKRLRPF